MLELWHTIRRDRELVRMAEVLSGAIALEPGGPSALFQERGAIPVYPRLKALDTLDFSEQTLWSSAGGEVIVKPRNRLIGEARDLGSVTDDAYDAVLASHVLEHIADPLGALSEWRRIVRPGGHVLLVMPHRDGTFDHRRPVTSLAHLREDGVRQTGEDDNTHLREVLELHDLTRDPGAPSREIFERRCRDNANTRGMHHHVFDSRAVVELCRERHFRVLALRPKPPQDIFCLCSVDADCEHDEEREALSDAELATILRNSGFPSDKSSAELLIGAQPSIPG